MKFLNDKFNYKNNMTIIRLKKYMSIIGMALVFSSAIHVDGKEVDNDTNRYDFNIMDFYRERLTQGNINYDDLELRLFLKQSENNLLPKSTEIVEEVVTEEAIEEVVEKKLVAITFDDGPAKHTDRLLDILEENDVKATFFVVGPNVKKYGDTVKRAYDLGHEIAIHGYTHSSFTSLSIEEVQNEILAVENLLLDLDVTPSKLVRPPYGSINSTIRENLDYSFILWNIDTEDWKSRNKDAVIEEINSTITEGSIILLHDIHSTTVDAMEEILPELIDEYEFVTIDELFKRNEQELESHEKYYKVKILEKTE